jgi:uncharacterized membrane protein YraQ (UPF0718 family)
MKGKGEGMALKQDSGQGGAEGRGARQGSGNILKKTLNSFSQMIPIIIGVLLLISLATAAVPKEFYSSAFTGNDVLDSLIGAVFGSLAAGNPVTSYVIGGELLLRGISLVAVAAFILAWVTVGIVQFPAESMIMGRGFALKRNAVSFLMSIVIACLVVFSLGVLG